MARHRTAKHQSGDPDSPPAPDEFPSSPGPAGSSYSLVSTAPEAELACTAPQCTSPEPSSPPLPASSPGAEAEMSLESSADALSRRVRALEEELRGCRDEVRRIQKQLSRSERQHRNTETHNQELQRQVEELSRKIHECDKTEKDTTDQEVQTDDYSAWSYSDYYYYANQSNTNAYDTTTTTMDEANGTAADVVTEHSLQETDVESTANSNPYVGDNGATADTQTTQVEDGISLAESLRATAEAAVSQTGFTYDESSGMYYDHSTGFYYDSETQLYYDCNTGIYYYCDVESGRYQFHSRVDLQALNETNSQPPKEKRGRKKRREPCTSAQDEDSEEVRAQTNATYCSAAHGKAESSDREQSMKKKAKLDSYVDINETESSSSSGESEPEEGEITDSENDKASNDEDPSSGDSDSTHNSDMEDTEKIWPPCIRVIVVRSPVLEKGSLFIITAVKTATIGREKDMGHTIRIPEVSVSKFHAEVYFDHNLQSYVLVDQGSQNGTVINGNPILQPKEICEPYVLEHGDEVKFGETVLSFHVHPGSETCDGCEPGQVRAHLRLNKKECSVGPILNKEGKELLRRQGLKQIRVKYGLQSTEFEDSKVLSNPKYKDRAGRRRNVVGSEGTFQREDAPSSVNVEINNSNKGRKMLEKMGWKKGEGLGKSGDGMTDPIQLHLRKKQAGLGSCSSSSVEQTQTKTQNTKNWEKARERYAEAFQDAKIKNDPKKATSWIKGDAE
ncbi:angiogenic factor with G patch and FHA domains 1 [Discoglossus pictus]